jgi:hypothetical protein
MTGTHTNNLRIYVNDMVALEREIHDAVHGQMNDERVKADPAVKALIEKIHAAVKIRLSDMETHAAALGDTPGKSVKEAVATVTGTLAGLYDKIRKHPVSRMLRDDTVALDLAAIGYSMLYTTALALRDLPVANVALRHLRGIPPHVVALTEIIPDVVVRELSEDNPDVDRSVVELARKNTRAAWSSGT